MRTANRYRQSRIPLWVWMAVSVTVLLAATGTAWWTRSGAPTPTPSQSPTPPDRVSPAILNAVATSEGTTAEEARQRLARQADLARLAETIAATLPPARTAGLYIDQRAGELVVNATTPGASGPKRKDMREVPVRYSSNDLDRAATTVAAAVAATGATGLTWAVDVRVNAVVIAVSTGNARLPATKALLAQAAALGPVVQTRTVKSVEGTAKGKAMSEAAGEEVAAGDKAGSCSVAWPVRDREGNDAILTAGHCVHDYTKVWTHAGHALGRVVVHSYGPRDFGVIRQEPGGGTRLGDKVNLYDGSYATLTGQSSAPVGSIICKSGATSGLSCGAITAERISSVGGGKFLENLVGMRMCSDYGDSGGAVFVPYIDGTVSAQGIISAGIEACNLTPGEGDTEIMDNGMYYQPVNIVLREQGLTLRVG
jgi:hypothetical protein